MNKEGNEFRQTRRQGKKKTEMEVINKRAWDVFQIGIMKGIAGGLWLSKTFP